ALAPRSQGATEVATTRKSAGSSRRASRHVGKRQHLASPNLAASTQLVRHLADGPPRPRLLRSPQPSRPNPSHARLHRDQARQTPKLPARRVVRLVEGLVGAGGGRERGRGPAFLHRRRVDALAAGVVPPPPAQVASRAAERDLFIIEEEIFVHPT